MSATLHIALGHLPGILPCPHRQNLDCRNTFLKYVFPFDESISFHRLCGYLVLICSAGHTICHIGNYTAWVCPSMRHVCCTSPDHQRCGQHFTGTVSRPPHVELQ